jgi:aspartate ammonia-lyase
MNRIERDFLGELELPSDALYGIHSVRARENFPGDNPFPSEWYKAVGVTKLACYNTYRKFRDAAGRKSGRLPGLRFIDDNILDHLISSASEVAAGKGIESFIVPAIQGGAGTSINMNINEIIANSALLKAGYSCGQYEMIDPIEDANIYQSTNDVIPTALTIAVMRLLNQLEQKINNLRQAVEKLEKNSRDKLRPGYTQMQEAVPSSFGLLFSTYNEALSRDWWRVSKCTERIKQVNLGGGATGTGMAVPRYFIMEVVPELRSLTGLPVAHSENLSDATSNLDKWVEIHATLKAHAINLEKAASDLRLLASDISTGKTVSLPPRQTGSSIMPGKVNPVIPEFIISASHKVQSNDMLISSLCARGTLELNAYLPVIGCSLIESLKLLIGCNHSMLHNMIAGVSINEQSGYNSLISSPSITTALVPFIGYKKAAELAALMKEEKADIFKANKLLMSVDPKKLQSILEPGNLLKLGFSIDDIQE